MVSTVFSPLPSRRNSIALVSAELERTKSKTKLFDMRSEEEETGRSENASKLKFDVLMLLEMKAIREGAVEGCS